MNKLEGFLSNIKMKEIVESAKNGKKARNIIIAIAVITGICIVAFLAYRYFKSDEYDEFEDDFADDFDDDFFEDMDEEV